MGFEDIRPKLVEFIQKYQEVEQNKNRIESSTAYVITNGKYYENLRHAFSHLVAALDTWIAESDVQAFVFQLEQSKHHLANLDVNGYEYLAGVFLEELAEKIEQCGLFHSLGNAIQYRSNALRQFDLGREKRTPDRLAAMGHFERCIQECQRGLSDIKPLTPVEKRNYRINIAVLLTAVLALIVAICK